MLILLLAVVAVAGCGESESQSISAPVEASDSIEHVHGLGVAGDALYIATHTGLWSAPVGGGAPRRVGSSRQDLMGFSVVRAGEFIASGHPAPDQAGLPPLLGLIASRDRGENWRSVSLLGEADFHVLEAAGERIYGFDGRLRVSSDGGRSWDERATPAVVYDLAVDPRRSDAVVAATERGLYGSTDAGRSWRPLRDGLVGLLAWSDDGLYLFGADGVVSESADGGRQWTPVGNAGGQPAAFTAERGGLYAALAESGAVTRSVDRGRSWTRVVGPR